MPIYEFKCQGCRKEVELILPMEDRNSSQACPECQASMKRLIEVPRSPVVPITGRDQVLGSLNSKDDGVGNKPHIKDALWKGLNQREPVVGRGFGRGTL